MNARSIMYCKGKFTTAEVPLPELTEGYAKVKMIFSSVCDHVSNIVTGEILYDDPIYVGHTGVGFVEEIMGDTSEINVGDRVIVTPDINSRVTDMIMKDGALHMSPSTMSDILVVHKSSLLQANNYLTHIESAMLGCSFSIGYSCVSNLAGVRPGDKVMVVGCNVAGLGALATLNAYGIEDPFICDNSVNRLERADTYKCSIRLLAGKKVGIDRKVSDFTAGIDVVIVANPNIVNIGDICKCVVPFGKIIIIASNSHKNRYLPMGNDIVDKEIVYTSNGNITKDDLCTLMDLTLSRKIHPYKAVSNEMFLLDNVDKLGEFICEEASGAVIVAARGMSTLNEVEL